MQDGGLTLLKDREYDAPAKSVPLDKGGQRLDGDKEHLRESEGGTYVGALPEELFVCPYIPEGSNAVFREKAEG